MRKALILRALMLCVRRATACTIAAFAGFAPVSAMATANCAAVVVGEFGGSPRAPAGSPRRPEIQVKEEGEFCLAQDVRQEKLMDPRTDREMTTIGGNAIVLIGADNARLDLGGHEIANDRALGYTLIKHYRYEAGKAHRHSFSGTQISNGALTSPGSRGVAIRLAAAGIYERQGLGTAATAAPGISAAEVFVNTSHVIQGLTIRAGKRAIEIDGRNNIIRNNQITVDSFTAIVAQGPGIVIEDNDIEIRGDLGGFSPHDRKAESLTPFPIRLIQADGAIIRNNRIRFTAAGSRARPPAAIQLAASPGALVEGNWIEGIDAAVLADQASPYQGLNNRVAACPAGDVRHLPPDEADDNLPAKTVCRQPAQTTGGPD